VFGPELARRMRPDPLARMHDELELKPAWKLLGSWPRWHPVEGSSVHPSVAARAKALEDLGRHDMTDVGFAPIAFTAGAQREWDRTGIVLRGQGERYRLTWKWGEWRDEECPPCGPSGQPGTEFWRRVFRCRRRLPHENYMTLCLTIAHPRAWPLREGGLRRLFQYLFVRDPQELRHQIAPVGRDLTAKGSSVIIQNNGRDGVVHVFANDAWMTAANNSGVLQMEIVRLAADAAVDAPVWTVTQEVHSKKRRPEEPGWIPAGLQPWRWSRSA
jgi:hypothetical protein